MSKRAVGAALICGALVLVLAAWAHWAWVNSDGQQDKRDTDALTRSMFLGHYVEPEDPSPAGDYVAGAVAAVMFISGIILVAVSPPPDEHDASDRQSQDSATL